MGKSEQQHRVARLMKNGYLTEKLASVCACAVHSNDTEPSGLRGVRGAVAIEPFRREGGAKLGGGMGDEAVHGPRRVARRRASK